MKRWVGNGGWVCLLRVVSQFPSGLATMAA